jgi:hypothetical protein
MSHATNPARAGAAITAPPDFDRVKRAARPHLPVLLARWLPDGHRYGREWCACKPTCRNCRPNSCKVNVACCLTGMLGMEVRQ